MATLCLFHMLGPLHAAGRPYWTGVLDAVEQYGGRYLVMDSGHPPGSQWNPVLPVLVQFPDAESAAKWYDSDEYRALAELRLEAAPGNSVFTERDLNPFLTVH